MSESFTARVIPAEGGGKVHITRGTKVMVGDVEMQGVTRIVLTAELDDVWRAEIHCHVHAPQVEALAHIVKPRLPWWKRLIAHAMEEI